MFREICVLLEADGRREVLFRLVSKDLQEATDCPWCRALYRQFVQECGERPRLAGVLNGAKRPESGGAASPKNPGQTNRSRYPRTDLIEVLSRLSEGLYDLSPGGDGVLSALRLFRDQMLGMPKLTPAERDYFDVMCEYLMSAWQGRFKASNHVPTPSSEEIAELFQ